MCGIVGYIGKSKATPFLVEGLKALEYRGYDSAGVAVYDQTIELVKTKGRLKDLESCLVGSHLNGTIGIGHTRWATHGEPSYCNAHPHMNTRTDIAIVHNGIIENYLELKEELEAKGYEFVSETDTETVVHLIEETLKEHENFFTAVLTAAKRLKGSYGLGVISHKNPDQIIAIRKDSPLVIGLGEHENFLASDIPAILKYTRNVYFLEDGEAAILTKDSVKIYDLDEKELKKEVFTVTWDIDAAEKSGYDHFMMKEIFEQPKVIKDTLNGRLSQDSEEVILDQIKIDKDVLEKINKIYIVACGTAYYAGMIGKELIEKIARVPVVAEVASEFRYKDPILDENTLMIVVSQSGETADTLAALRMAKQAGARVMAIVNVVGSTISREAHDILYTSAGPEIAVASTKAYSSQLIAMYLLSIRMGRILGKIDDAEFTELKTAILKLPEQVQNILDRSQEIKALADKHLGMKNIFYIGRGLDYATSLEGALKIKEVAYLHAESYQAGELKHGPIALIEKGSVLMGLLGQESLMEKTISNIKEVKARGADVIAIALEGNAMAKHVADDVFMVPKTHWMLTTLLINIPQQLFAYYISCGLGHDVDKPRNLAKSVTVE
jgi:glucosamine--fructose-6-phosphate aminotransferase (isomerizing)